MPLFKSGDPEYDQYARYTTEELIKIVTDNDGLYNHVPVETARRILLSRGLDYRTPKQKTAEKEVEAVIGERQWREQQRSRVRPNRPASGGKGLKTWQWVLIVVFFFRIIGCLLKNGH